MRLAHDALHDLVGHSARLSAILSLIRNPETRDSLDAEQVNADIEETLKKFQKIWAQAYRKLGEEK